MAREPNTHRLDSNGPIEPGRRRAYVRRNIFVIASEAKQSSLDCRVAFGSSQ
jgi:hypothetical protein